MRKFTNQLQIRSWRKTSWVWYTRKYETCARRIAAECAIRSTFKPESNADCLWHKQLYPEQAPVNQFWVELLRKDWITDLHQPLRLNLNSLGQPCTCLGCHFRYTTRWWIERFRNRGFERKLNAQLYIVKLRSATPPTSCHLPNYYKPRPHEPRRCCRHSQARQALATGGNGQGHSFPQKRSSGPLLPHAEYSDTLLRSRYWKYVHP